MSEEQKHTTELVRSKTVLNLISHWTPGVPLSLDKEMADEVIGHFNLKLECGPGCMSGELMALFQYNGQTLRLMKAFPNNWQVFRGEWKPDPRWAGD